MNQKDLYQKTFVYIVLWMTVFSIISYSVGYKEGVRSVNIPSYQKKIDFFEGNYQKMVNSYEKEISKYKDELVISNAQLTIISESMKQKMNEEEKCKNLLKDAFWLKK